MQQTRYNLLQLKWWNRLNGKFIQSGNLQGANRFVQGIFKEITTTGVKTLLITAICVQAQTANIFARLFTFETGRLPLKTEMFHRSCDVSH
jgi:hypothetical protein